MRLAAITEGVDMGNKARSIPRRVWLLAWLVVGYLVAHVVAASAGEVTPADARAVQGAAPRVAPSVVVVRARGRDAMAKGDTRITETGLGVLISVTGRVLTAASLVHGMEEISVRFPSGETVSAKVVASAPAAADLALLQLDRLPPGAIASLPANSDTVWVGDTVWIPGVRAGFPFPLDVRSIKTRRSASGADRTTPLAEFFRTDAAIDPRNTGGPVFNRSGEVIGIVSHNISSDGRGEPRGVVVTSNTAMLLLLEKQPLRAGGEGSMPRDTTASAHRSRQQEDRP